eukprot:TRINITY_DN9210_c0_g1_i2.p1 TRINITY_DN9210_c0_g1~~TRINITY_DN9210_c0_g1_i2.p1  ORF type:complete len:191 (-),score=19.29 TRINITY_DN9210_c0_g1_i2:238-810(-)
MREPEVKTELLPVREQAKKCIAPPLTLPPQVKKSVKEHKVAGRDYRKETQKLKVLEDKLNSFLDEATIVLTERKNSIRQLREEEQLSRRSTRRKRKPVVKNTYVMQETIKKERSKEEMNVPESNSDHDTDQIENKAKPIEYREDEKVIETAKERDDSHISERRPRNITQSFSPERSNVFLGREKLSTCSL